jgi:polysaccharide pyruvyl transferase WcaK-like protein
LKVQTSLDCENKKKRAYTEEKAKIQAHDLGGMVCKIGFWHNRNGIVMNTQNKQNNYIQWKHHALEFVKRCVNKVSECEPLLGESSTARNMCAPAIICERAQGARMRVSHTEKNKERLRDG